MDDNVSLDHRDPTHPVRGLVRTMFETRKNYPVLKDGYYLEQLSNMTYDIYLPGSNGTPTEMGMWSVLRSRFDLTQDFTGTGQGNQSVWLVYQNDNRTVNYRFNCSDSDEALISPFDEGTTVKNLLPPFEEFTLESSNRQLRQASSSILHIKYILISTRFEGSKKFNGCLPNMSLPAWGFKAFVPKNTFVSPSPFVTKFKPGHDWRILSAITTGERIPINFEFSEEMDCGSITNGLSVTSSARDNQKAQFDKSTVSCNVIPRQETTFWEGALSGVFNYSVELENVFHGVHEVILKNVTNKSQNRITNVSSAIPVLFHHRLTDITGCRSFHSSNWLHGQSYGVAKAGKLQQGAPLRG
jgi:alpha-1,3-glucan synthase